MNLFIVFLLTGIWHGANWTFVLWGIINGVFVVFERLIRDKIWYKKTPTFLKWCGTMAIVFFSWIVFMSENISGAISSCLALIRITSASTLNFTWQYYLTKKIGILILIAGVGAVIGAVHKPEIVDKCANSNKGKIIQKALFLILFVIDVMFVVNTTYSPFLYFQF